MDFAFSSIQKHRMERSLPRLADLSENTVFLMFISLTVASFLGTMLTEQYALALLPFAVVFIYVIVSAYRWIYLLFFFLLPFSVEVYLTGGFGTDLPSEPLMLILCGVFFLLLVQKKLSVTKKIFTHPISAAVLLHLVWIYFISIFSSDQIVSFKYALAKTWYIIPFYFLSYFTFDVKKENSIRHVILCLWLGLCIALTYVMLRHFATGFSFKDINEAVRPIFRNHVNYASMLVVFLPYLAYLMSSSKHKWLYTFSLLYLMVAIYFSYTRAAQLSIFIAALCYFVIRFRLSLYALLIASFCMVSLVLFLVHENKYLDYAPNFETTVAHYKFDNLIEATYKMEDISTMERVHRWVAGFTMVGEKPLIGFGPGCFYPFYKNHTVSSFKTYVSDNPEKSGIHNNFLMVFVEQGVIGFIIMLILCFLPIVIGEQTYHLLQINWQKNLVMAATVSIIVTVAVLLINDLLEADKVGPIFFLSLSIIAILNASAKKSLKNPSK